MGKVIGKFKRLLVAAIAAGALLAATGGTMAEVIRLQGKVAVDARQDVRLGDIATISGGDSRQNEELANMVIISGVQRSQKLKAESVLMAVMAQRGTGGLGSLQISGAAECEINLTIRGGSSVGANVAVLSTPALPIAEKPTAAPAAAGATVATVAATAPAAVERGTLRQTILATLAKAIDLPEGEYDVTLDSNSPQLDRAMEAGKQWLCRPMSKTILGTVPVESQLVEGTKILQRLNISTTVRRKQMVVVLTKKYVRGDLVTADGVRTEVAMLDRKLPTLFGSMAEVVGLEALRDVAVGEKADQHDFRSSLMAHKGQIVTVVYISGALQLQTLGRAADDAKLHERIQIKNDSTGQMYSAVMIARGIGVAGGALTEAQEKKLVEALQ